MQGDLDDFVNDGAEAVEEVEATQAPAGEGEATTDPAAEGKGEQQEVTATPADEPEDIKGLKAALKAERRKRQAAEREAHAAPPFDPSVFYQDPAHIQSYVEQQTAQTRLLLSQEFAREQYADYGEMEEIFVEAAEANPGLIEELRRHPAPALYAYKTAKQLQTVRDAQDGSLEARITAQVEARIRAEYEARAKAPVAIPPDLSGVRSSKDDGQLPDESLESILSRQR